MIKNIILAKIIIIVALYSKITYGMSEKNNFSMHDQEFRDFNSFEDRASRPLAEVFDQLDKIDRLRNIDLKEPRNALDTVNEANKIK